MGRKEEKDRQQFREAASVAGEGATAAAAAAPYAQVVPNTFIGNGAPKHGHKEERKEAEEKSHKTRDIFSR